jgi:hypothetical protein
LSWRLLVGVARSAGLLELRVLRRASLPLFGGKLTKLAISPDLKLPIEAVTQTLAFLAKRGAGKTYTAGVVIEEMLKARQQVVVVDPLDVWWGLRASADGKSEGLPITVLGGPHGDLPLYEDDSEIVAKLIVEQRISVVLSLRHFRKAERTRFMTPFLEQLYHLNREPLHLAIDEADAFAPQKPMKGEERMLGAMEDIVRRGRSAGLGISLISQRSAVLNKNVLTQVEVLVALRTIAPQDMAAIDAWIQEHGSDAERKIMMDSLPSLPIGDSWWWSPGWLDVFKRIRVRQKETFDSSKTPKVGEVLRKPKKLAPVDLEQLRAQLAKTIEKAKLEDPRELRKIIAERDRTIAQLEKKKPAGADPQEILRIVALERQKWAAQFRDLVDRRMKNIRAGIDTTLRAFDELETFLSLKQPEVAPKKGQIPNPSPSEFPRWAEQSPGFRAAVATSTPRAARAPAVDTGDLTPSRVRVLQALADLAAVNIVRPTKSTVAVWAGTTPTSSTFEKNIGALRTQGLLDYPAPGLMSITAAGNKFTSSPDVPTLGDLHERWFAILPPGRAKILRALVDIYDGSLTREQLSEKIDQSQASSTFEKNLGALRSLGVVDYPTPGEVAATSLLFPDGLR